MEEKQWKYKIGTGKMPVILSLGMTLVFGGLVAPNQGLFPEYDAGIYTENNTNMLVSRGVGNSILPFRINNRPEVILIELQAE